LLVIRIDRNVFCSICA